jgi:hypothetical protein
VCGATSAATCGVNPSFTPALQIYLGGPIGIPSVSADGRLLAIIDNAGTLHVSERNALNDPFPPPVPTSIVGLAEERAALFADGLAMVAVSAQGKQLRYFTRTALGQAFREESDGGPFGELNLFAQNYFFASELFGSPVISPDGLVFVFNIFGQEEAGRTVRISRRASTSQPFTAWSFALGLTSSPMARLRPFGVSEDGRNLFLQNEQGNGLLLERGADECPFRVVADLGGRAMASPSARCAVLYSATVDAGQLRVRQETRR